MILLIGGEKGGTGKTTIATNLAAAYARGGEDVVLVDTDPQGSAAFWAAVRDEDDSVPRVACVRLHGKGLAAQVRDLGGRYGMVLIDAGGRDSIELRSALTIADRVLVPIQASQYDTWTLEAMSQLIDQASALNPGLSASVVINRASPNPRVGEVEEARELIEEYDVLHLTDTVLRDRIAYRRAARYGLGVAELGEHDEKAAGEVKQLYEEMKQ